jgi:hypothetical protein
VALWALGFVSAYARARKWGCGSGRRLTPNDEEKNRTIDGNVMFYHNKTERWIPDCFPLGAKVTQEAVVVTPAPLAAPTIVSFPLAQADTATDGGKSNTFTKDEISEMKSNLNMIMDSQSKNILSDGASVKLNPYY